MGFWPVCGLGVVVVWPVCSLGCCGVGWLVYGLLWDEDSVALWVMDDQSGGKAAVQLDPGGVSCGSCLAIVGLRQVWSRVVVVLISFIFFSFWIEFLSPLSIPFLLWC